MCIICGGVGLAGTRLAKAFCGALRVLGYYLIIGIAIHQYLGGYFTRGHFLLTRITLHLRDCTLDQLDHCVASLENDIDAKRRIIGAD
jgi:hypothetical protein